MHYKEWAKEWALGCVNPASWLFLASSCNLGPTLLPSPVHFHPCMAVRLGGGIADIMAMIPMLGATTGPAWPPGVRLLGPPRAPAAASPGIPIPTERRKGSELVPVQCGVTRRFIPLGGAGVVKFCPFHLATLPEKA